MNGFTKIDPKKLPGNATSLFADGWALLTAGTPEDYNTMTISWGQLGQLWNLPVCTVFVRPCRYTYEYTEKNGVFTVSIFDKGEYRPQLNLLGTKSGRDIDKMHDSGLTPVQFDGQTAFAEARAVLVLEKLYDDQFDMAHMPKEILDRSYPGLPAEQLHRFYFCKITSTYLRK